MGFMPRPGLAHPRHTGSLLAKIKSLFRPRMRPPGISAQHLRASALGSLWDSDLFRAHAVSQILCRTRGSRCLQHPLSLKSSFKVNTTSSRDFLGPPKLTVIPFACSPSQSLLFTSTKVYSIFCPISYGAASFLFQVRSFSEAGAVGRVGHPCDLLNERQHIQPGLRRDYLHYFRARET